MDIEEKNFQPEYQKLKHEFDLKYQEIYNEMNKFITGESMPTLTDEEISKYNLEKGVTSSGLIPNYWITAVKNSKFFEVNSKDEEILKHLENITITLDNTTDFTINFHFAKNDYFDFPVLHKTFLFSESTGDLDSVKSTQIEWKEGKNPKIAMKKKKVSGKGNRKAEFKQVEETVPSFFDLFGNDEDDIEGAKAEAEFLKDTLIPFSLEYFLNIVDEEDNEEPEEDDDEEKPTKKKAKQPKGEEAKNEKCKNQ